MRNDTGKKIEKNFQRINKKDQELYDNNNDTSVNDTSVNRINVIVEIPSPMSDTDIDNNE